MATVKMLNRDRVLARLAKLPKEVIAQVDAQVRREAAELTEAVRRAVPVKSGALRDSVRFEAGDRPLAYVIKAGDVPATRKKVRRGVKFDDFQKAKAEGGFKGEYDYALAVEFGHRTEDGKHVPAEPFLFPTYRARKKAMRRRVSAAARKGLKSFNLDATRG